LIHFIKTGGLTYVAVVRGISFDGISSTVGSATFINNGVTVGRSAFLAMGALVSHDVPPHFKAVSPHRKEAVLTPIAG
jgi:acyl-[acyl carrier protein]--UDP-N-acetylglucosamine O-acyltransferase